MKLGAYTFEWAPDKWSIPDEKRDVAYLETYDSVAFFSWGPIVKGSLIKLVWRWMPAVQYQKIKDLEIDDTQIEWDAEADDKVYYSGGLNTPFVAGKTITGGLSAVTATIASVDTINRCLKLSFATGSFTIGETITDNSIPAKSATVQTNEQIPVYNVEIVSFNGEFFDSVGPNLTYREALELNLLIMSEA